MEFRLTYQGLLLAESQRRGVQDARAAHKHSIRKAFHPQLKRLWDVHPYLSKGHKPRQPVQKNGTSLVTFGAPKPENTIPMLADRFARFGYRFVPLVTRDLELLCAIDVLFLRNDPPGSVLSAGDIDNRLKTLLDGLLVPREQNQIGGYEPEAGEDPFFCLLEDDSLLTKVTVETDTLLAPTSTPPNPADARVIVTVRIKPYMTRYDTLGFA